MKFEIAFKRCWPNGWSMVTLLRSIAIACAWFAVVHQVRADETAILIRRCALFDPSSGEMLPDRTILIKAAEITAVVKADEPLELPSGTVMIEGSGKFVLPGLIDAHTHLVHGLDLAGVTGDEILPLYLAAGVTSVRSTGDEVIAGTLVARIAAAHPQSAPRVFTCSPLLDNQPAIHRGGWPITDPAKVPQLMDEMQRWNVATIKIYAGTGRTVGKTIIAEAHQRGMFVTAHLGRYFPMDAVADGLDCIEHIQSLYDFIIPQQVATQPGNRATLDLDNPLCQELVAALVEHKTYVDPTLTVFRNMILLCDVPEVKDAPDVALVPRRLRDFWPIYAKQVGCPFGGPLDDRRREFAKYQELTGRLFRAGVPLLVGTDAPEPYVTPGFSLHQEMERLVESGLPPAAVLRAATMINATVLRQEQRLGSVAPGKQADLILLSANPLDDIRNTRQIELVIHGGNICHPAELLKLVPIE